VRDIDVMPMTAGVRASYAATYMVAVCCWSLGLIGAAVTWLSIKFALILAISGLVLLASYHYMVRSTFIGKFLNGRRYERALPMVNATPSTSPG
jgi:hypothetical protein